MCLSMDNLTGLFLYTEIRRLRISMWEDVEERKHWVVKVFPASFEGIVQMHAAELMLYGSVAYRLKKTATTTSGAESEAQVDWAAHAKLRRDGIGSPWRFEFYRVYLQR